ncbi:MAG TPA: SDR family oxidoreductase [Chthoniobacterales bacterium]|jgi:NAD(P)-dependent dehydrogenase (short-subunit alcohol dehydrogenase family)
MPNEKQKKQQRPAQRQRQQPGRQYKMHPPPDSGESVDRTRAKLAGKVALVTGGDSGIGRAVAVLFAKEGADSAIVYLNEHRDAQETLCLVEKEGRKCLLIAGDIGQEKFCQRAVRLTIKEFGRLDILVNNAAEQRLQPSIAKITEKQLLRTFRTNIFAMFFLTKAALPHLKKGATIINTASVTTYKGSPKLIDYTASKGAIVGFTRSLALSLVGKGIRVNAIAPGPIWTPIIASTLPAKHVATFGCDVAMKRAGEPREVATCFLFLASDDSSYMTGQVLHPNGGTVVNS